MITQLIIVLNVLKWCCSLRGQPANIPAGAKAGGASTSSSGGGVATVLSSQTAEFEAGFMHASCIDLFLLIAWKRVIPLAGIKTKKSYKLRKMRIIIFCIYILEVFRSCAASPLWIGARNPALLLVGHEQLQGGGRRLPVLRRGGYGRNAAGL